MDIEQLYNEFQDCMLEAANETAQQEADDISSDIWKQIVSGTLTPPAKDTGSWLVNEVKKRARKARNHRITDVHKIKSFDEHIQTTVCAPPDYNEIHLKAIRRTILRSLPKVDQEFLIAYEEAGKGKRKSLIPRFGRSTHALWQ